MKVRCISGVFGAIYAGRFFPARLMEDLMRQAVLPSMRRQILEIYADGVPIQLEPPCAVEVVEATVQEWEYLQEVGYELHGTPSRDG